MSKRGEGARGAEGGWGGGASWLKRPRTQTQAAAGEAPGARGDAQGGSGGEGEKGVANGGVEGGRRCEQDAHIASCRGGGAAVWAVYLRERTFGGGGSCVGSLVPHAGEGRCRMRMWPCGLVPAGPAGYGPQRADGAG